MAESSHLVALSYTMVISDDKPAGVSSVWQIYLLLKNFSACCWRYYETREHAESANLRQGQNLAESFLRGERIVSWFDVKMCSKVIEDGATGQNTYDFLLVFYSNFGHIFYRFCATVDFTPKWPCWATVTSKWQWRSLWITSKMKSPSVNHLR